MVTFNVDTGLDANTSPWLRGRGKPSWWTYSPSTFATRWPLLVLRGTAMGAESLRLAQSTSTTVWRLLECVLTLQRSAPGERGRCHAKIQRSRTDVQARTGDWAFYIERYYAQKRNDAGKAPDHYLFPAFDPATQSMPTLRQILTSYGYRYIGGDSKATTTVYHLSKPALIAYFADHIDEMRSERGVYLLSNDSDEAGGLADALGKMHFSGRPETAVPCRDTTPAEQRGIDSVFGKPIEVKQEVGVQSPVRLDNYTGRSASTSSSASQNTSIDSAASTAESTATSTSTSTATGTEQLKNLDPRKVLQMVEDIDEITKSVISSLRTGDIAQLTSHLNNLHTDLVEELLQPSNGQILLEVVRVLGCNIGGLTPPVLKQEAMRLSLDITSFRGTKPEVKDYV